MDNIKQNIESLIIEISTDESTKKDAQRIEALTHLVTAYAAILVGIDNTII